MVGKDERGIEDRRDKRKAGREGDRGRDESGKRQLHKTLEKKTGKENGKSCTHNKRERGFEKEKEGGQEIKRTTCFIMSTFIGE